MAVDKGNFFTNTLSGVTKFIKPVQDAVGGVASGAANAVGGVAQGALTWGKANPAMAIGAVALAAVGTAIVANKVMSKDKEEETAQVRGGFAEREMQRREAAGQYVGR